MSKRTQLKPTYLKDQFVIGHISYLRRGVWLQLAAAMLLIVVSVAGTSASRAWAEDTAKGLLGGPLQITSSGPVQIAHTSIGPPNGPPVLMIMGLTASHRMWGEDLVGRLVAAGLRVILFDNRDTGASQRLDDMGQPLLWWNLLKWRIGLPVTKVYTLTDMATDAAAVLDAQGVKRAHVMGASMGGMIAQTFAVTYPERTASLISIMSTTNAPHLPPPSGEAEAGLRGVEESSGDRAQRLEEIGLYPSAMRRQLMAILGAGDRTDQVAQIYAPTLVQHGMEDTLLPLAHGEHTAATIPDAQFLSYAGMGHNLPKDIVPVLAADIVGHIIAHPIPAAEL